MGRLLVDDPASGSRNMAVDAAILENVAPDDGPTLRFYRWSKPTLSLGYFQSAAERAKHTPSNKIDFVRRTTGGGAIVHEHELTYSLIVPQINRLHGADALLYQSVHQAFINVLGRLGLKAARFGDLSAPAATNEPFLCFQRRTKEDLVVSGYKVLGSAQRRGANGILQHGSLLLASSSAAPELPGLLDLADLTALHGNISGTDSAVMKLGVRLIEELVAELGHLGRVGWTAGVLSEREREAALRCENNRFTKPAWNFKR